ncbi:RNA polymerase sigma factor [Actinomadura rubrisoli]|uniref:Sigma-70 family RNA polymerase sigma factor n=1 Tax=Actinomadura rubrisoli TaxID=2530368 RepID=A0A4R5BBN6_9ACTN|nr:sigma-70 family RNA polymerase sigma factor [Actinomadura rubrisoli]TDD83481.1 sigma-70 family RNA polymerase sigma factor [Actinomadura rubrisoli]
MEPLTQSGQQHIPPTTEAVTRAKLQAMREPFLELFEHHHRKVVAFLMSNGATLAEAQDAAQDAFLEAWQSATSGTWEQISNPPAWIRVVALRRYRRPPGPRNRPLVTSSSPELLPDEPASALGPEELTTQTLTVLGALQNLDEECKTVMAFHLDDFPAVEIAKALRTDAQKVRNLLKKARAQLAQDLAAPDDQKGGTAR